MFAKILFFSALAAISFLAFLPNYDDLPDVVSFSDTFNHAAAFFVLTLLCRFAFPALQPKIHVFLMLLYGLFIEAVQHFLPTRYGDPFDVLVDIIGIALAYAIILKKF
ncbi:MAG: VanZ family protein [Sulfurimonas sp.]|nr:MAG: VanZ family protein [Sulfurimonas sp.]